MPDDLIHARVGDLGTAFQRSARLLRNQGSTVYDIYNIHYAFIGISIQSTNEAAAVVLSTRVDDQVNDVSTLGLNGMVVEEGLFGAVALLGDELVEGGTSVVAAHDIVFPKPYTVPWLAAVFNVAVATSIAIGVDIWFVRRQATAMDKASLVARLGGGKARTE